MTRLVLINRYFHPDESATSQFATDLARHLAQSRRVEVLTSRQLLDHPTASLPPRATLDRVVIHRLWSTRWGRRWLPGRLLDYLSFLTSVAAWLLWRARAGDVVLAKTDPPLLGVVTTLATLGRGVRRVQWLQDLYPETAIQLGVIGQRSLAARTLRVLRDWSLRRSELVVTVCRGMVEHLAPAAGTARVIHLPNWGDDLDAEEIGAAPDAPFTVGYSGNLGRAHPIEALLELAERPDDPAMRFLFSGGGANHQRLRERVEALGRQNWAFLPYQPREQLGALLRRSHVHLVILDPRVERFIFPSKVFGILAAGRPIVHLGDPDGEVARLLREHECGWTVPVAVPVGDSEGLSVGGPLGPTVAPPTSRPGPLPQNPQNPHTESSLRLAALLADLRRNPEKLAAAGRRARAAYESKFSRTAALAAWDAALPRV